MDIIDELLREEIKLEETRSRRLGLNTLSSSWFNAAKSNRELALVQAHSQYLLMRKSVLIKPTDLVYDSMTGQIGKALFNVQKNQGTKKAVIESDIIKTHLLLALEHMKIAEELSNER